MTTTKRRKRIKRIPKVDPKGDAMISQLVDLFFPSKLSDVYLGRLARAVNIYLVALCHAWPKGTFIKFLDMFIEDFKYLAKHGSPRMVGAKR